MTTPTAPAAPHQTVPPAQQRAGGRHRALRRFGLGPVEQRMALILWEINGAENALAFAARMAEQERAS